MNKFAILLALFFTSCAFAPNNAAWSGVVDEHDPRTAHALEMSRGYCANETESWLEHFSDDAVVHVNDVDMNIKDVTATFAAGHATFKDIAHEDLACTTMRYNNGEVYTNLWYTWTGKVRSSGETLRIKGYAWFKWEGDKIIESYNAFDPTKYNAAATGTAAEIK
jgi:hypothetical protein